MLHRFAGFELDTASLTLQFRKRHVELPGKAVATLAYLADRAGSVVTKAELMDALWPDGFVEEANLAQYVYLLRRAFLRHGLTNVIETHPRRGYSFHPPDSIAPRVWDLRPLAAALAIVLTIAVAAQPRPAARGALSSEAESAYALGRYFWNLRSVTGMTRSLTYFRRVIALAPNSALGYAALADAYTELVDFERPCDTCAAWRRSAEAAASAAIALDQSSAEAHTAYGMAARVLRGDDDRASREFHIALALEPENALANQWYGNMLIADGHFAEGIDRLRLAAERQPVSTATYAWLARGYYYETRYAEAERYAREALALEPTRLETNVLLGLVEESRGRYDDALTQFVRVSHLGASDADARALSAGALAGMGRRAAALRVLEPLVASTRLDFYASRDVAIALAMAGERRQAKIFLAHMRYPWAIDRELTLQDPHIRSLSSD